MTQNEIRIENLSTELISQLAHLTFAHAFDVGVRTLPKQLNEERWSAIAAVSANQINLWNSMSLSFFSAIALPTAQRVPQWEYDMHGGATNNSTIAKVNLDAMQLRIRIESKKHRMQFIIVRFASQRKLEYFHRAFCLRPPPRSAPLALVVFMRVIN